MSNAIHPSPFLRFALLGDAIASGATGLLLAAGAGLLANVLGLPEPLMRYAGLFLLPYAAIVGYLGTRPTLSRGMIRAIIIINAAWAVQSVFLLVGGGVSPTMLGTAFVVAQALVVAGFAEAQWLGMRKSRTGASIGA